MIEAGLDALAAEDAPVGDAARLERVRPLVAVQNRISALLAGAVREAETQRSAEFDGLKSMKPWLCTHTRLSGAAVTGLITRGPPRRCRPRRPPSAPVR